MKQSSSTNGERQYWLWVTTPDYYLDEDGSEREDLEPRENSDAGAWWTCSRYTKKGDLILLWRARGASDIKYLIQAASDAYPIGNDEYTSQMGWNWGCDYEPLYKFKRSITLSDLRMHPRLQDWNAVKAQFRSRSMRISPDDWHQINEFAAKINPDYKAFLKKVQAVRVPKHILLEEQLEETLAENLGVFKKFGYDLELYRDEENEISGRQFVCIGVGGRIDLLCRNRKTNGFTVIELKNVRANRLTFGQICEYISYVKDQVGKRTKVDGIVVSRGYDASFQQSSKLVTGLIRQIDLSELGFE